MDDGDVRIASISGLRGLVGRGLDPAVAVEFAAAYAVGCARGPIVVGHDGRVSAEVFVSAVASGIAATGRDVLLVGATATPTLGFLVREKGLAGGVQISASHNPAEYNGLKFFQPRGMVLGAEAGLEMLDRWRNRQFGWVPWNALGHVHPIDEPDQGHLERVLSRVDLAGIRRHGFTVMLDAGHGAGGRLGGRLLRELGCQATVLGPEPDGLYDHPPEPTEANLADYSRKVREVGAAVGFAQDPDADRLAIIDENGRYLGEELTLALAARRVLETMRGPVVINLSTSSCTEELAVGLGCEVWRTPVGEINVVERMLEVGAVLGGEGNGGVIDPRVGLVRDSFVGMALVLDLMAATGLPLSRLADELPRYCMIKARFPLPAGAGGGVSDCLDRVASAFPDAQVDRRDGARLAWPDRFVHARGSNTEPILRVIAEARTDAAAEALIDRVGALIHGGEGEKCP